MSLAILTSFSLLSSVSPGKCRSRTSYRLSPLPFRFLTIQQSTCHSTLYKLSYWQL